MARKKTRWDATSILIIIGVAVVVLVVAAVLLYGGFLLRQKQLCTDGELIDDEGFCLYDRGSQEMCVCDSFCAERGLEQKPGYCGESEITVTFDEVDGEVVTTQRAYCYCCCTW